MASPTRTTADDGRRDPAAPLPTGAQIRDRIKQQIKDKLPVAVSGATGHPEGGDSK